MRILASMRMVNQMVKVDTNGLQEQYMKVIGSKAVKKVLEFIKKVQIDILDNGEWASWIPLVSSSETIRSTMESYIHSVSNMVEVSN